MEAIRERVTIASPKSKNKAMDTSFGKHDKNPFPFKSSGVLPLTSVKSGLRKLMGNN